MADSLANAESRAKDLIQQGDKMFSDRGTIMSLWQELANNFYVERADFTVERTIGITFAENLMTSYPLLVREDLGNQIGAMLRPKDKEWFIPSVEDADRVDSAGRAWLYTRGQKMRRAMYDRKSQFTRATKEADHDFAAFGQNVVSIELSRKTGKLLYRDWHLRDVAWCENAEGEIATIHRKWKIYACDAVKLFPGKVSQALKQMAEKSETKYQEVELRHVVLCADDYPPPTGRSWRQPYVSIYIETATGQILEEVGSWTTVYNISRWKTVSGSQYAYSPATVCALPDARLIQSMTLTLLEAGEMAVRPPLVGVQEALRSDLAYYAGGTTWMDADYDERTGEALRPLNLGTDKNVPLGRELRNDVASVIREACYLNKLTMPSIGGQPEKTAFEVGQIVQQFIRQNLPLFEPMEQDYNGGVCEQTFELMMRAGAFGPIDAVPRSLRNQDMQFKFVSPLSEAVEAQKAVKLQQAKQIVASTADVNPASVDQVDWTIGTREALRGVSIPATWLRSPDDAAKVTQSKVEAAKRDQVLTALERGSGVVKNLADAAGSAQQGQAAA